MARRRWLAIPAVLIAALAVSACTNGGKADLTSIERPLEAHLPATAMLLDTRFSFAGDPSDAPWFTCHESELDFQSAVGRFWFNDPSLLPADPTLTEEERFEQETVAVIATRHGEPSTTFDTIVKQLDACEHFNEWQDPDADSTSGIITGARTDLADLGDAAVQFETFSGMAWWVAQGHVTVVQAGDVVIIGENRRVNADIIDASHTRDFIAGDDASIVPDLIRRQLELSDSYSADGLSVGAVETLGSGDTAQHFVLVTNAGTVPMRDVGIYSEGRRAPLTRVGQIDPDSSMLVRFDTSIADESSVFAAGMPAADIEPIRFDIDAEPTLGGRVSGELQFDQALGEFQPWLVYRDDAGVLVDVVPVETERLVVEASGDLTLELEDHVTFDVAVPSVEGAESVELLMG